MIYFAHRGYGAKYPENTLLAFDKAVSSGALAVELDVHKTKDGKLVVIHDENVKRTFNGSGLIKDMTLCQLKSLTCNNADYSDSKLCRIPTLSEVLELIGNYDITINIEIKTDIIHYENIEEDILKTIADYNLEDKIIISSFNFKSLEICRALNSKIRLGVLFHTPHKDIIEFAKKINAYSLHPYVKLVTSSLIDEGHKHNLKIYTYTVNSPSVASSLEEVNCDGIFTDDIKKFITI